MRVDKKKTAEYFKKWYYQNKEVQYKRIKDREKSLKEWLKEYKSSLKCIRCSESHISCLDFHHRDPKEKDLEVGKAVDNGWGKKRILEEINKCDVLCSNCHRKLHYEEMTAVSRSVQTPVL